ncbi:hypothetical protein [Neokomagataea thailandica]|uniref:Uncharacterized protein n=1 Tax=Neokomagataea tanensis NBRC 106556 TaxID=1223519 RepID=A0ABQ0QJM9_9PROT|nr:MULTISPECIES: hypothetical protein [Neokomagataea]GBR47143.1 hypothetical protein AA106556_1352 [Neokomagataea tanensis NBRC 106556]
MPISLDPTILPSLNIIDLATQGLIVRAERETPEDGLPIFITRPGWEELLTTHTHDAEHGATIVLPALEKAVHRLLAHVAHATHEEKNFAPLITVDSDLFQSAASLLLAFVRDSTHPVACVLIGTEPHIATVLKDRT